jgi:hypothetical protein
MKIEEIEVFGFSAALRGMRNPLESWDKSDTIKQDKLYYILSGKWTYVTEGTSIGQKDLALACKLIKAGTEHRKFLRQIQIWCDMTLPRYIHTELDTYKIATVRNSCSTMHKLGTRDLTQDDFEKPLVDQVLNVLNRIGREFRTAKEMKEKDKVNRLRREYKNMLPEGFLQKSTFSMNYETALSMYFQRKNHRLPEWNIKNPDSICSFIYSLPYMEQFIKAIENK